ncbi:unnamed protein product [Brassicogethes aeneus]|uniref:Uncharacterized protein n=1 Tax=Brassicogethes aeneus TaxID=1431903 RepID=A0A9P0BLJ1_BRAAE|nr:unnamed protein product [Brassicogethes aeneus]
MVKIKGTPSGKTPIANKRLSAIKDKSTPFKGKKISKGETPKLKKAFELASGTPKLGKKLDLVGVTPKKIVKDEKTSPKGKNKINIIDIQVVKDGPKRRNTINAFEAQVVKDLQVNQGKTPKKQALKRRQSIAIVEETKKTPKCKNSISDIVQVKEETKTPKKEPKTPKDKTVKTPKVAVAKTPKIEAKTPKSEPITPKSELKTLKTKKLKGKTPKKPAQTEFAELEEKYNIKSSNIEEAIKGVIKFVRENPKMKNQLFGEKLPLLLQMGCFKIHRGQTRLVRIPLKNSTLTADDDVCLIVADIKGLKNKDHDQHLEKYEELLTKKGVKNIKKIMTFHEFRTEYETIELKNRLVDLYDYFLVEGKIAGKVVRKCGKIFYKKRKVPNPIKLWCTQLKKHIDASLLKTQFNVTGHGDSYTIQFGHSDMDTKDLVENVFSLIEGLDKQFPGGFNNIKLMQIFTQHATPIPIYLDTKDPNEVQVPVLKPNKINTPKRVRGELSTVTNADVIVSREGNVKVIKNDDEKGNPDEITIDDLLADIKKTQKEDATIKNKKKKAIENKNEIVVQEENANKTVDDKQNKKRKLPQSENDNKPRQQKKAKKGNMVKKQKSPVKVVPKKKKVQK